MIQKISEQAVLLGRQQSLVGILTRALDSASRDNPAVVILNTGIIHRVGHHRMYVTMSRSLARAGYTVLRFDFSGIGDSNSRVEELSPVESCLADIKDALDWLEREYQVSRIILVGLCSGADHAVLYGHGDARVVALVLMDPTIPATARYYLHYITRRLTRLRSWTNVVAGRSRILKVWTRQLLNVMRPGSRSRQVTLQDLPSHPYLERSYQSCVDRGIHMLAIFTEDTTRQSYQGQMLDAFPNVSFGDQLKTEFFRGSDHIFTLKADRARLIPLIFGWVDSATTKIVESHVKRDGFGQ
jgi:pimeloyl-ACP methyl ester carboxylesterase